MGDAAKDVFGRESSIEGDRLRKLLYQPSWLALETATPLPERRRGRGLGNRGLDRGHRQFLSGLGNRGLDRGHRQFLICGGAPAWHRANEILPRRVGAVKAEGEWAR